MIFLDKNTVNKVVLTLDESSSLSSPFYLFKFKNEYNLESEDIFYYTPDLSNNRGRYNLFHIEESSTGSSSGGFDVPLKLTSGQYAYTVYESTGATISFSATTQRIVEEGKLVVGIDTNNINSIYF